MIKTKYDFRVTIFNEVKEQMEKLTGVNSLKYICDKLRKAERAEGYHIVEFHVRRLTPHAEKLRR